MTTKRRTFNDVFAIAFKLSPFPRGTRQPAVGRGMIILCAGAFGSFGRQKNGYKRQQKEYKTTAQRETSKANTRLYYDCVSSMRQKDTIASKRAFLVSFSSTCFINGVSTLNFCSYVLLTSLNQLSLGIASSKLVLCARLLAALSKK